MKSNTSLIIKITFTFIFTFILLIFAFFSFYKMDQLNHHKKIAKYYETTLKHIRKNKMDRYEVIKYLENIHFSIVDDPHKILRNIDKPIIRKKGFEMIVVKQKFYLHVVTPHFRILFEDKITKIENSYIFFIVFGFISLLFLAIYFLILKNIKDTNLLLNSRQLFLRTVIHELKTPIAKGRIVSELIDDEKQKQRMADIFEKLNFLIDDFAKIETIVSKNYKANLQNYTVDEILQSSFDMLLLDNYEQKIKKDFKCDDSFKVDIDLMAMAVKNILDNGIEYSPNHIVKVEYKNNELLFISSGKKLPRPLNEYFEPFHNDTINKNHGMGLGLYIVYSIVLIHGFSLKYIYENNQNIFKIVF